MAEFLESVTAVSDEIKSINAAREPASSASSLLETSNFYARAEDLGIAKESFAIRGEPGNLRLTNDGEPIDLDNAIKKAEVYGDVLAAMRSLKIPEDVIAERPVQKYAMRYKALWDSQPGNVDINSVKSVEAMGEKIEKELGVDPSSYSEMEKALAKKKALRLKLKNRLKTLKKELAGARSKGELFKTGRWVKSVVFGTLVLAGASAFFAAVQEHQKNMNGCWLVDIVTGEKCKIKTLTCGQVRGNVCGPYNVCGKDGLSPCFSPNTCVRRDARGNCEQKIKKCTSGTCSAFCIRESKLKIPRGKRLQCVSVNMWGATADFLGESFSGIFSHTWLYFAIIVVVGLAVLKVCTR